MPSNLEAIRISIRPETTQVNLGLRIRCPDWYLMVVSAWSSVLSGRHAEAIPFVPSTPNRVTRLADQQNTGSEALLGAVDAPSQFKLHTKIASGHPAAPSASGWHSRDAIAASISASLKDLGVDSVETMMLHVPDRETPLQETLRAIHEAYVKGQFKKFGISNYSAEEVQQMLNICEAEGLVKPSVYEGHYNAVFRSGEQELFPLLRKHGISFWAYRYVSDARV